MPDKTITLNDLNASIQTMGVQFSLQLQSTNKQLNVMNMKFSRQMHAMDTKFTQQMQNMDSKFNVMYDVLVEMRENMVTKVEYNELKADVKIIKLAVADLSDEVKHHTKQIFKLNRKVAI